MRVLLEKHFSVNIFYPFYYLSGYFPVDVFQTETTVAKIKNFLLRIKKAIKVQLNNCQLLDPWSYLQDDFDFYRNAIARARRTIAR